MIKRKKKEQVLCQREFKKPYAKGCVSGRKKDKEKKW